MARKKVPEDRWTSLKSAIVRKWNELTDEDLAEIKDDLDKLATRLQARYGLTLDEAGQKANQFLYDFREASASVYRRARLVAGRASGTVDDVAHTYTWSTVAGAFLLGGLIGYLCAREEPRHRWF